MSDGKITIDAEIEAKRAESQLLSLEIKLTKLADKIKALRAQRDVLPTEAFAKATQRYKEAADGIDRWAEKMEKLRKAGKENSDEFARAEKAQDGYWNMYQSAEEQMESLKNSGGAYQKAGDSGYDELTLQIQQAEAEQALLGARWRSISEGMHGESEAAGSGIMASLAGAAEAAAQAYTKASQVIIKGFRTIWSWASKIAGIIKNSVVKAFASAVTGFRNIFTGGKSAGNAISDFGKRVANLVKAAVVFNVIRKALSAVTSGIGEAVSTYAKYSDELNAGISAMQTALSGLQGSIASAFAPVISAAVPAIVTLINYLTSAVNALGMFFAALTGKASYTKLVANQKNYAASLEGTAAAAKDATSNLAKFDDLDVLDQDTGSGAGGSGADYSGLEEVPIDSELADLFGNGDFFDFGYLLADMLADALEQIPWEDIRTRALEMGQHLAEILNGVFANLRLAVDLGITIAQAINTALDFAYGFITTFNWTQFGVWWGYFFNAFVQTMDWNLLGDTILAGVNGVIASIQAFFTTIYETMQQLGQNLGANVQKVFAGINWTGIADTIMMGMTDITAAMNGWNLELNWTEIADSMTNGVNELARGMVMDPNGTIHQVWSENGTAVGIAIQNFLSGVHEFITQFPFEQLTESISQWFRSAIEAINWSELGDTINGAVTGLIDSITQFINDPQNRQEIVTAITDLFTGLDFAGIVGSIGSMFAGLFDLFTQTIEEMDWATLGTLVLSAVLVGLLATNPIILAVAALTLLIAEVLLKLVEDIADGVSEWMSGISDAITETGESIRAAWSDFWTSVKDTASNIWNSIKTTISTIFTSIQTFIQTTITNIKNTWNTIWTAIKTIAATIWTMIRTTISTVFTAIGTTINTILNTIRATWNTIWTAISTIATTIWNAISTTITTVFNAISATIATVLGKIKTTWSNIWNGMKDILKSVINGIIGLVNGMLDAIVSGINSVINALNSISVDIPSWVPGVGGSHFGLHLSHVSAPHIPTLANGGITTGATLAEIGEAGREAVLPLEQNTEWMDELAMKIADVIDSRTGTGINSVTMELNGQELARVALDDLISEIGRRGLTVDTVFA